MGGFVNTPLHCRCGSGLEPFRVYDARMIYCGLACDACEEEFRAKFRPEIFTDSDYDCDEPIDPD